MDAYSRRRELERGVVMGLRGDGVWFGFLQAGEKSSPVVRDTSLDTGKPSSIYLFNLRRGAILEYQLAVVEGKLRELTEAEAALVDELRDAFQAARASFTPRRARRPKYSSRALSRPLRSEEPEDEYVDEIPYQLLGDDDVMPGADGFDDLQVEPKEHRPGA
jgi:hypothetical protein